MINRSQSAGYLLCLLLRIYFGMCYVIAGSEKNRLAENDISPSFLQFVAYVLDTLEPNQLYASRTVRETSRQPLAPSFAHLGEVAKDTAQLDIGHIGAYLPYGIKSTPIDIAKGEIMEKIQIGTYFYFLLQYFRPLRPYAGQVSDFGR